MATRVPAIRRRAAFFPDGCFTGRPPQGDDDRRKMCDSTWLRGPRWTGRRGSERHQRDDRKSGVDAARGLSVRSAPGRAEYRSHKEAGDVGRVARSARNCAAQATPLSTGSDESAVEQSDPECVRDCKESDPEVKIDDRLRISREGRTNWQLSDTTRTRWATKLPCTVKGSWWRWPRA